ncbi:MAG: hypothetical protein KAU48_02335, partial [Candidatus Thorarchaeota archaeon]|nr:hypothetical protein [Candidatus Thorarchaeota archaeon]
PDRGGKIVQIAGNCSSFASWQSQTAIDAIDWLAPRPKGKILFDLSHLPAYGVDTWDIVGWTNEYYYTWRDALVSRAYTFDKLLPSSSGNLTTANLAGYDMLIIPMSDYNYTSSEISAIISWVNNGGGLFVMGDQTYSLTDKQELNRLLSGFSLSNNITVMAFNPIDTFENHPITEGCSSLQFAVGGALNYSGTAYPIWYDSFGNTVVAGNDYGDGRVILTGDLDFLGHNQIANVDNFEFGVNVANWLSAATAEVLFYIDNADIANPYDAPAVDALNDLGIPFYLTYKEEYMNLSLHSQQWSLVILDSAWPGIYPYLDDFSAYLDTGGELIISWHMLNIYQSDPFYSKVGI